MQFDDALLQIVTHTIEALAEEIIGRMVRVHHLCREDFDRILLRRRLVLRQQDAALRGRDTN